MGSKGGLKLRYKIWVEKDGKPVLGEGGARLLRAIREEGSLSAAASKLNMSYVFAWEYIQRITLALGVPVVETKRGGKHGGGTYLTEAGERLLQLYEEARREVEKTLRRLEARLTR